MKKKAKASESDDEMRAEYDFSKLKLVGRGIYAERYRSGTNIVLLDDDVRKALPDERSVDEALRESHEFRRMPRRRSSHLKSKD
jgi:hypothetical protein